LETTLGNLYLTEHGYKRGALRNVYPGWLHFSTANEFIVTLVNQTKNKQIKQYGTLTKVILPTLKVYVRDSEAIVTLVKRRRRVG
jgi:hypothetical protein